MPLLDGSIGTLNSEVHLIDPSELHLIFEGTEVEHKFVSSGLDKPTLRWLHEKYILNVRYALTSDLVNLLPARVAPASRVEKVSRL